ncbi:MAG TPA: DMT family transporter [Burkholderiales bacterium]|nr:DMT family transporter [Burkholderiales bacterium]
MRAADAARLVTLAAIWGASFLFIRIATPVFGVLATADVRMLIAGGTLAAYYALTGFDAGWRRSWRYYVVIGVLNCVLPFLLFGYAALYLTVGLLVVLNATSPMWGALLTAIFQREPMSPGRIAGLVIGVVGVGIVSGAEASERWIAVVAGLAAAFSYGLTGLLMRRWAKGTSPRGMAAGSLLAGGVLLAPMLLAASPAWPGLPVALALLALGVVCGAIAYVLYFRLIADIGPTGALTVTYLIPLFGMVWGALFLGEAITASMIVGALVVILGTVLVLRN